MAVEVRAALARVDVPYLYLRVRRARYQLVLVELQRDDVREIYIRMNGVVRGREI